MKIYRLAENKKFQYLGQCNNLRCENFGEDNWKKMIENKQLVNISEFKSMCNYEVLIEDDETLEEFISDCHDSYFAKSIWGKNPCYYLMTKGFEFIFVGVI